MLILASKLFYFETKFTVKLLNFEPSFFFIIKNTLFYSKIPFFKSIVELLVFKVFKKLVCFDIYV